MKETRRNKAPRARKPRYDAESLAEAGVAPEDIALVTAPAPDLSELPEQERLARLHQLGMARLRADLLVMARVKALGKGRAARAPGSMLLLAGLRNHLRWDASAAFGAEPPDLDAAHERFLALVEQQRRNLLADGYVELPDGSLVKGAAE